MLIGVVSALGALHNEFATQSEPTETVLYSHLNVSLPAVRALGGEAPLKRGHALRRPRPRRARARRLAAAAPPRDYRARAARVGDGGGGTGA